MDFLVNDSRKLFIIYRNGHFCLWDSSIPNLWNMWQDNNTLAEILACSSEINNEKWLPMPWLIWRESWEQCWNEQSPVYYVLISGSTLLFKCLVRKLPELLPRSLKMNDWQVVSTKDICLNPGLWSQDRHWWIKQETPTLPLPEAVPMHSEEV